MVEYVNELNVLVGGWFLWGSSNEVRDGCRRCLYLICEGIWFYELKFLKWYVKLNFL